MDYVKGATLFLKPNGQISDWNKYAERCIALLKKVRNLDYTGEAELSDYKFKSERYFLFVDTKGDSSKIDELTEQIKDIKDRRYKPVLKVGDIRVLKWTDEIPLGRKRGK